MLTYFTRPSSPLMIHPPSFRANSQSIAGHLLCASHVVLYCAASSSASARKITSRESGTRFSASIMTARANTAIPPLKSMAPRPKTLPSRTIPANGSTLHFSRSTPTTSACAARRIGLRLPSPFNRAKSAAFPASGVGTISVWKPSAENFGPRKSAIRCSCPGGLLVSMRIRSASSWAVGSTPGCAGALAGWKSPRPDVPERKTSRTAAANR